MVYGGDPGCFDANSFVYILNDDGDDDVKENCDNNGKNNLVFVKMK